MENQFEPISDELENWCFAKPLSELRRQKAMLARIYGKQIALFDTPKGIHACDNRCPHEGFPLSEGDVSDDCKLTCNWHNWKFDLSTGENMFGGDKLRTYPVDVRGDEVWVDISDPPYPQRYAEIVDNLRDAFEDHEYDRIAREIARLSKLGADPLDSLRLAIEWSWQRMEFGWTHAYAGMADWLVMYDENNESNELQLVCLVESFGHASFDVLREPEYPYCEDVIPYDELKFLKAIEEENEFVAVATIRGGLMDGLGFGDFEQALSHAALAHYNDFGHTLIYVTKIGALIDRLGATVAEPLLLSLVREMIYSPREEKIPEFRDYQSALAAWDTRSNDHNNTDSHGVAEQWHQLGIKSALDLTLDNAGVPPEIIYRELLKANAINMLSFDLAQQDKIHVKVSGNVGWLDFTHGLTFANAVRKQCSKFPELWSRGLLQMACFLGRNAAFTTKDYSVEKWCSGNVGQDIQKLLGLVLDHGQDEYIVSVHLLKTTLAVRQEIKELPEIQGPLLAASLTRFMTSPLKRKQTRRTAYQSLQFVSKE